MPSHFSSNGLPCTGKKRPKKISCQSSGMHLTKVQLERPSHPLLLRFTEWTNLWSQQPKSCQCWLDKLSLSPHQNTAHSCPLCTILITTLHSLHCCHAICSHLLYLQHPWAPHNPPLSIPPHQAHCHLILSLNQLKPSHWMGTQFIHLPLDFHSQMVVSWLQPPFQHPINAPTMCSPCCLLVNCLYIHHMI